MLDEADLDRYSRQLVLPEWSGEAQERLGRSSAIVVGAGALGSPAATYLVGAGVGRVGIVDDDEVELSNLPRQPLHFTPDIGANKAESAAAKLSLINPDGARGALSGAARPHERRDHAERRRRGARLQRFLRHPLRGQRRLLRARDPVGGGRRARLRRPDDDDPARGVGLLPLRVPCEPDPGAVPSCSEAGVLGPVAGIVGSIQALEALKLLAGVGEPLLDHMVQIDARTLEQTLVSTTRLPDCPACARVPAATQSS